MAKRFGKRKTLVEWFDRFGRPAGRLRGGYTPEPPGVSPGVAGGGVSTDGDGGVPGRTEYSRTDERGRLLDCLGEHCRTGGHLFITLCTDDRDTFSGDGSGSLAAGRGGGDGGLPPAEDRKSTRLNSSHGYISY